jgi:hypothetical protein
MMGWPKLDKKHVGAKCHTVTNRPFFEVDKHSVHFETECHSSKKSQGRFVTVVKLKDDEVSQ